MFQKTPIWTYIHSRQNRGFDESEWMEYGGKWLVYGSLAEMKRLAREMDRLVEKGEILSAKFWNASDASAMCVYSLDRENKQTLKIIKDLGHNPTAWEYDYARRKNWTRPRFFLSAFYKLRILIKTFGVKGTFRFIVGAYI